MQTLRGDIHIAELTVYECDVLWEETLLVSACFGPNGPVAPARGERLAHVLAEV